MIPEMRGRLYMTVLSILLAIAVSPRTGYGGAVVRVKRIEFEGLRAVSKYEILRHARLKTDKAGIVIDVDSVRAALRGIGLVDDFDVDVSGETLSIEIEEKGISRIVMVRKKERYIPVEVDQEGNILSVNTVHLPRLPLLYMDAGDMGDETMGRDVMESLRLLRYLEREEPRLYEEMAELHCDPDGFTVRLKGRPTRYIIDRGMQDFRRLHYVAGYFDARRRYPGTAEVRSDTVLVR